MVSHMFQVRKDHQYLARPHPWTKKLFFLLHYYAIQWKRQQENPVEMHLKYNVKI